MTTPPTITAFLLARYDETEILARAATEGPWELGEVCQSLQVQTCKTFGSSPSYMRHVAITLDSEGLSDSIREEDGRHIAHHDPAHVLADIASKRAIVVVLVHRHACPDEWQGSCPITRYLASVYADHPDYQQEWTP